MIWVTWRQHRTQVIVCAALLFAITVAAVALGAWMRSTFSADGLGACLARTGGAGCPGVISSFTQKFTGAAMVPLGVVLAAIPGYLGATVGAPLLGQELERGTWQLAWSQTVPRTRWLVTQLALVVGGLVVFGAAVTAVVTWARAPLDEVSVRVQPLNYEGLFLTCSLLCAFALGVLAGLLLRNTIGASVVAYIAWEVPFVVTTLLSGPLHILAVTKTITCTTNCAGTGPNSVPPVTGNLGDVVISFARTGNHIAVTYLPASRFWTLQLINGGLFLAVAAAALGTAVWLLHRRTT